MSACTRCGGEKKTVSIFIVRPGGHTWLPQPEPESDRSLFEQTCGDCITDQEIRLMLGSAVEFVLGVLIKDVEGQPGPFQGEFLKSLEIVRAPFLTRSNEPDNRRAALRALGLTSEE